MQFDHVTVVAYASDIESTSIESTPLSRLRMMTRIHPHRENKTTEVRVIVLS